MTTEDRQLKDQVVLITGGASGIGRATCHEVARRGGKIVLTDINEARIATVVEEIRRDHPTTEILGFMANVRDEQDVANMVHQALDRFGAIDVLAHCAGILRPPDVSPKFLHQTSLEEWDAIIETNLTGTFLCNRAVVSVMIKQRRGQIINISSTSGRQGRAFDSAYCASKFGMIGLSESLAQEVRQYGIRVHVLLPDAVDTPIWEQNGPVSPPVDALPAARIADIIVFLSGLPEDTILDNLVIRSFLTRRRKKKTVTLQDGPPQLP
jgi:NAD(P)-dependent dehydrogenase (short-subunit alcohol dehydrogenase family)